MCVCVCVGVCVCVCVCVCVLWPVGEVMSDISVTETDTLKSSQKWVERISGTPMVDRPILIRLLLELKWDSSKNLTRSTGRLKILVR